MKQLLDPLGTLCKLVGLNFTKIRTKIKIQNHVLTLDKPTDIQFVLRWYHGDGKDNMWELYEVIVRIIRWYILPVLNKTDDLNSTSTAYAYTQSSSTSSTDNHKYDSDHINKCQEFRRMVQYMCDAFTKLQETYKFGNVVLTLQYYINILQDALNGNFDESRLPQCVVKTDQNAENLLDYNKIRNLWDTKKMKRVCELYDSCFAVTKEDMDDTTKDAMTDGYLRSITAILDITDKEFQKLINNSNEG